MPTYLIHGFRWNRASIRIHIILQDLEDAAAEWIVAPATSMTLLNSFYTLFDFLPPSNPPPPPRQQSPVEYEKALIQEERRDGTPNLTGKKSMRVTGLRRKGSAAVIRNNDRGSERVAYGHRPKTSAATSTGTTSSEPDMEEKRPAFNDWSVVKLVEQYDPDDLFSLSQPYAYVADHIVEVRLSSSILEEMAKYEAKIKVMEGPLPSPPIEHSARASVGYPGDSPSGSISPREQRRRSRRLGWLEKLRDGLEKESSIGWYVVVCGDEERAVASAASSTASQFSFDGEELDPQRTPTRNGLRGLFQRKKPVRDEE